MEKEEEGLIVFEAFEKLQATAESLFYIAFNLASPIAEDLESPGETVVSIDVSTLRESARSETVRLEDLRQGRYLGRQDTIWRVDAVLSRIETGEDGHMGRERSRKLDEGVLEEDAARRKCVDKGAGPACVAVTAQMVGSKGVDRYQDEAPGRCESLRRLCFASQGQKEKRPRKGLSHGSVVSAKHRNSLR